MIQVIVKNLSGETTHAGRFETQDEAYSWIMQNEAQKAFGKPERWVHENDLASSGDDKQLALESQECGHPESMEKIYKFKAQYTIEQSDITAQILQQVTNEQSLKFLESTDWYVIRKMESGVEIPDHIMSERAAARRAIVR